MNLNHGGSISLKLKNQIKKSKGRLGEKVHFLIVESYHLGGLQVLWALELFLFNSEGFKTCNCYHQNIHNLEF